MGALDARDGPNWVRFAHSPRAPRPPDLAPAGEIGFVLHVCPSSAMPRPTWRLRELGSFCTFFPRPTPRGAPAHPARPEIGFVLRSCPIHHNSCPRKHLALDSLTELALFGAVTPVTDGIIMSKGPFAALRAGSWRWSSLPAGGELGLFCTFGIGLEWWNDRTLEWWDIPTVGNWLCFAHSSHQCLHPGADWVRFARFRSPRPRPACQLGRIGFVSHSSPRGPGPNWVRFARFPLQEPRRVGRPG